jgi:hypothetical protein
MGERNKAGGSAVADEVYLHIRECDRMYRSIRGECDSRPECNVCKKLLKLGVELDFEILPELCIQHCERWKLPDSIRPPASRTPGACPDAGALNK